MGRMSTRPRTMTARHPASTFRSPAVAISILLLAACAPAPPVASAPDDSLRVMTFNIRYGTANDGADAWPHRRQLVFNVLRNHDPDLVGLQEALRFQLDEIRAAAPGFGEIGVGRADGREAGEYAAILYRADRFDVLDRGTFWFSDTPEAPGSKHWGNQVTRICTWARLLDRHTGRSLHLFNLHLDHRSQPSRARSVDLLLTRIAALERDGPVIITGDFNAGEDNPAMLRLLGPADGGRPRFADTYRIRHPDSEQVGTFGAFRGETSGAKIDYVIVSPEVMTLDATILHDHVDERYPSDHYPVMATVRLPG
ncbi:MAG: endonuclease/exonuclease/phosphatase family protein [Planctomycetota bacterium]